MCCQPNLGEPTANEWIRTVRTKNTLTIVSQYPNRHVQIVLRLYKSISQILTGFDVNCEWHFSPRDFRL